jgi:HPt (histidine-containing phosphotransfer) domain-containing protein
MLMRRWSVRCHAPAADASSAGGGAGGAGMAPPGAQSSAVLDPEALERLAELDPTGKNRLVERVFQAFESSTQRLMPQLHAALSAGDHAGVRHVAHTLKSSSASIGAIKLSQLCAEIESMIRLESLDDLPDRIGRMDGEATVVLEALRRHPNVAP